MLECPKMSEGGRQDKKTSFMVQGCTPYLKLSDISGRGNLRFNQAPNNSINSLHSPTKSPCSPICPPEMINSRWVEHFTKWSAWIIFKTRLIKGHFNLLGLSVKEVSCGQLSHRNSCRLPPWFSNWKPRNHDRYKSHHHHHNTRHCFCLHLSLLKFSWSTWRVEPFITELVTKENTRYFAN